MGATEEAIILTRLVGAKEVVAGLEIESEAMGQLAVETDAVGIAAERTRRRSFLMNQALFTMRRFLYLTTLATIGLGAASLKWGFDYLSQMQQGQIALGKFMGSNKLAKAELDKLFIFSAFTPFQFKDVVSAASMLMRFNINASTTNRILRNVTDALAGTTKATPGGLNRIATALGHMMSMGHATGQVLLQLARDGIPGVYDAVKKYFGLTDAEMHHIGTLGLPATDVMRAINQYIEHSPLHGLAKREALGSLHGLLTTSRDFISRIFGQAEKPGFNWFQKRIAAMNVGLQRAGTAIQRHQPVMPALFGKHPGGFGQDVELGIKLLKSLWTILDRSVIPAFRVWLQIFQPLKLVLLILVGTLGLLAAHTTLLKYALIALFILMTPRYVLEFWGALATNVTRLREEIMLFRVAAYSSFLRIKQGAAMAANLGIKLYEIWVLRAEYATLLMNRATEIWSGLLYTLQFRLLLVREAVQAVWFWMQFRYLLALESLQGMMETTAIAALVMWDAILLPLGIITLIGVLVILYFKWKAFRDIVNSTWHFLMGHKWTLNFLPLIGQIAQLYNNFMQLYHILVKIYGLVRHPIGSLTGGHGAGGFLNKAENFGRGLLPFGGHIPHFPHLASGGSVIGAGWSWIGERGPELQWMPTGAAVVPATVAANAFPWGSGQFTPDDHRPIMVQLVADGKVLAEVVAAHRDDIRARS